MNDTHTPRGDRGLAKMVRAHLLFGLGGFCLGLVAAALSIRFGPEFMRASPFFTMLSLVLVTTIAGAMTGGLLSLSPLHGVARDARDRP